MKTKPELPKHLLKFPKYLPNDIEGFMFYYPAKFPAIVPYFEEVVPDIAVDPQAFRDYGNWARDELGRAFDKIREDYNKGDKDNLAFLVEIDERLAKMYCFRFWIVNYLLPDGPIHDYVVDNLKNLIRKFISVTEDVEDFENKVVRIQRDLLQSDYADYYLSQALDGMKALELIKHHAELSKIVDEITPLIDTHDRAKTDAVNQLWERAYAIIKESPDCEDIRKTLELPLEQVEMRSSMQPLYNMLTHAVEFRDDNEKLSTRYKGMGSQIEEYKQLAQKELSDEDYDLFELCYQQARNFTEYKDVMGSIDTELLPFWFGMHKHISEVLQSQGVEMRHRPTGPTGVSHHLVWFLPPDLKARVMTPDETGFDIEKC